MLFRAEPCGCERQIGMSRSREPHFCPHQNRYQYTKGLGVTRAPDGKLQRATPQISPASDAQREKVRGAISIISAEGPCHPAHILDRRYGGCDDPLCVIPLTPFEHRDYEENRLDVLPALIAGGYYAELAHVIGAHEIGPLRLVELTTGVTHIPESEVDRLRSRVVELEGHIHA